jgi:hypothetical protein
MVRCLDFVTIAARLLAGVMRMRRQNLALPL